MRANVLRANVLRALMRAPAAAALLMLGGCLAVPEESVGPAGRPSLGEVAARLPAEVAGFSRDAVTEYEARQPGYGMSVAYGRDSLDAVGTVFLYDRGLAYVPADPRAPVLAAEFERLVGEISAMPEGQTMRAQRERGRFEVAVPGGAGLRCTEFAGQVEADAVRRVVCLGAAAGRFLQAQVVMPEAAPGDPRAFVRDVARAARGRR